MIQEELRKREEMRKKMGFKAYMEMIRKEREEKVASEKRRHEEIMAEIKRRREEREKK